MKSLNSVFGWLIAFIMLLWRLTCRYRVHNDPRPKLREAKQPFIYAILHAHQISAVFLNDDPVMAAMVSRSADGDLLVPSLKLRRVHAVRGSTRKQGKDKGGREALAKLADFVRQGIPALLAVDGPRGPRNHVHKGVADLALSTGAAIAPAVIVPSRRFILTKTWDRLQLPAPFSLVQLTFAEPIFPAPDESSEALRARVRQALSDLERATDPTEHPA